MKKISFKKFSLLGLALTGIAALTTAMIPSKTNKVNKDAAGQGDGQIQNSTIGGVLDPSQSPTVRFVLNGPDSYTTTGAPANNGDGFSATSIVDGDGGTLTVEMNNPTGTSTTH